MARRKKLLSTEDAKPAKGQHRKCCSDCPWARDSLPGWLGGTSADDWLRAAHGNVMISCHTLTGAQCAGSAIYRRNVLKRVELPLLTLPADKEKVFATPTEFKAHHEAKPMSKKKKPAAGKDDGLPRDVTGKVVVPTIKHVRPIIPARDSPTAVVLRDVRAAIAKSTLPERELYEALVGEAEGWRMRLEELDDEDEEDT